jgi:hypothetical protein
LRSYCRPVSCGQTVKWYHITINQTSRRISHSWFSFSISRRKDVGEEFYRR